MHCTSCNEELSDFESTRKTTEGEYIDLCNNCYRTIKDDVDTEVRFDLMSEVDSDVEFLTLTDVEDMFEFNTYTED